MTTYQTLLGPVTLTNISMERGRGYGQYKIVIDLLFEGEKETIKHHSTDSELWDDLQDVDSAADKQEFLTDRLSWTIEEAINDFISSK